MVIIGKALGQKKPLFADWSIPAPPEFLGSDGTTLRQLIDRVVRLEVTSFERRQEDRQLTRALTAKQIAEGAARGKIQMGASDVPLQPVDVDSAVGNALQSFEDGLYLVAIDGVEQRSLDQQIFVDEDSQVVFIRLTLLAGG